MKFEISNARWPIPATTKYMKPTLLIAFAIFLASTSPAPADNKIPKPQFQGDYFGEMARSFCTIVAVDAKSRALVVKRDRDGEQVRVPIRDDTELRFRDSWGELEDFFPGQHVMLFMYVDEEKHWTYPRAVQDEIQVSALHHWYAKVTQIDAAHRAYSTHREEKNKEGKVTKVEDKTYVFAPDVKVWKSATPTGIEGLQVGDEIIQQQVETDGKLTVVEILDVQGDTAVREVQTERHRKDQDRLGLPAYINDLEVISGSLTITIAWSGAERARTLKPGDLLTITPVDGSPAFGAAVASLQPVDSRERIELAINARVAARLGRGEGLRVFMPGTRPAMPTGKSSVPAAAYK